MARILSLNGLMWCAGMVWRDYGKHPSAARLRSDGRLEHATHYARYPGRPQSAAFLTISSTHAKSGINSLAIATATCLGPLAYAEFDMGGGDLWVIATDEDGELLPGSDQFYDNDTLANLRDTLEGQPFTTSQTIAEADLQDWFRRVSSAPVALHPVSLHTRYALLAAAAVLGLAGVAGWELYSAHEAERLAREAREASEAALRNRTPPVPPSGPSEIVAACMQAINQLSPLSHGWALASLQCEQGGLGTRWTRVGGSLLDAPAGQLSDNADSMDLSVAVHPRAGRAGTPREGDPVRLFVGMLQRAGITPAVGDGKADVPGVRLIAVRFPWHADPRAIDWNSFPRLAQVTLRRAVLTKDLQTSGEGYDITAVFAATGAAP
jgi:hypothetical protein